MSKAQGKKPFTKEEIEFLRTNRYVTHVSETVVKFSEDFKRYFYLHWKNDKTAPQLFAEIGIDPKILGRKRIEGFCYQINQQAKRDEGFADLRRHNYQRPPKSGEENVETRIRQLEHELAYTRQEVEFLKKLQMADMEAREQWESRHRQK
ncbi:MAG: hypothetical protein IJJ21_02205 [Firmicutes bacterium]|nr:hypothetical protein [Bacillota bacterium]